MLRRLLAEALGTAFLLATVVGSGIMASQLSGGSAALALLCNAVATGAILVVLITVLEPVSGAHLNPAVSLAMALDRRLEWTALGRTSLHKLSARSLEWSPPIRCSSSPSCSCRQLS